MKQDTPVTAADLRKARESLGETQELFADRIGVHQGTLSHWEAGKLPKRGMAQALVRRVLDEISRVVRQ